MKCSNLVFAGALLALAGCGGRNEARVERWQDGAWRAEIVTEYRLTGARDGTTTHATGVFTLSNGDRLSVDLDVFYNPTPVLSGGRWVSEGSRPGAGQVHEESLVFLGGQGATPSVGGRFRLDANGTPSWRVSMPAIPLARP